MTDGERLKQEYADPRLTAGAIPVVNLYIGRTPGRPGSSRHMKDFDEQTLDEETEDGEAEDKQGRRRGSGFIRGMLFGALVVTTGFLISVLIIDGTLGRQDVTGVLTGGRVRSKLRAIGNIIDDVYLYDTDADKIETYMFKGLMAGLDDKYAAYYSPEEMQDLMESTEGAYVGIGVILTPDVVGEGAEGESEEEPEAAAGALPDVKISFVYEGSPAEEAGLLAGDIILRVNGEDVRGKSIDEVSSLIRETAEGLTLGVLRGQEELEFAPEVSTVEIPTVESRMLDEKTGYVKITEFDSITVQQFRDALDGLLADGAEALVIDLRDNPGGNLDAVCSIADRLLPECLIVYTEDRAGEREEFFSDDKESLDIPIAVLVNEDSASAAEILAGALGDNKAAVIVGKTTFGKGVVQRTYSLGDGSGLKLTAENYFTPSGTSIDGTGITPDVDGSDDPETKDVDEQLEAALAALAG